MIDVGQGDSTLIKMPYNKGNILIDTGGIFGSEKIVNNITIPYLKSLGIKKLDYLILTHGDFDHMGEAINLVNNFKINQVIFNIGEYSDIEQKLIEILKQKQIPFRQNIKEININKNKLFFLNNNDFNNENDNSQVIYTEINNNKILLMGDAGIDTEKEIIKNYNISDITLLKIGHHGSKTSTSEEFINRINPTYSVISVGKNNRYSHPNKEVLNIIKTSKIYRTDINESIMFQINKKLQIKTSKP